MLLNCLLPLRPPNASAVLLHCMACIFSRKFESFNEIQVNVDNYNWRGLPEKSRLPGMGRFLLRESLDLRLQGGRHKFYLATLGYYLHWKVYSILKWKMLRIATLNCLVVTVDARQLVMCCTQKELSWTHASLLGWLGESHNMKQMSYSGICSAARLKRDRWHGWPINKQLFALGFTNTRYHLFGFPSLLGADLDF